MPRGLQFRFRAGEDDPCGVRRSDVFSGRGRVRYGGRGEAFITSEYRYRRVDIVYFFDDDESYVLFASPMRSFDAETRALTYKGIIPGQKAGRKVTFRVRAITAYDVVTYSDPRSYTIPDGEGDEKNEQSN